MKNTGFALWILVLSVLASCTPSPETVGDALPADAEDFLVQAQAEFLQKAIKAERAAWVKENFITADTEKIAAEAEKEWVASTMKLAKQATRYDEAEVDESTRRKLDLLKVSLTMPAPSDDSLRSELAELGAALGSMYAKGKYCPENGGGKCLVLGDLVRTLATSRDPDELRETWVGWRTIAPPMREKYREFVRIGNQGARELGFADLGALWRSKYDMPADDFTKELDRLWEQVRPLYEALHCHVRAKLAEYYGHRVLDDEGMIPAHLLGNMWSQAWSNIYDLVAPPGEVSLDVTELLRGKGIGPREMVEYGERFFSSLGFEPLPQTFWERSLFTKPADREVQCHASAWDIDWEDDIRIKMCIDTTGEDFVTIHHELGHNYYQRAYSKQPVLFRDSANDGFHEGIGDTLALSITPAYLAKIGLLAREPADAGDLGQLMRSALDKVAFLPFGLLIDQWRWKVFSGEISPEEYNAAWWELRHKYQGIEAPVARSEEDFDPGAKYHVPANTPYTRYFLAHILQFQFHRGLCRAAGYEGPLHRCSIYGSKEAGERLRTVLEMGQSKPWPDALEAISGEREMDATAILDYFAPLTEWLDEQNADRTCGW